MVNSTKNVNRGFRILLISLYLVGILSVLFFFLEGIPYYLQPNNIRVHDAMHMLWKPGGFIGHGFGFLGSTMMILMLLYSVRKRMTRMSHFGKLNQWLHIHIFFGIFGPLFIVLHSTFKLNGLVAVSFWSMIAVAISGVIGRFLYLQIPRDIFGEELSLVEAQDLKNQLNQTLREKSGLPDEAIPGATALLFKGFDPEWNSIRVIILLLIQSLARPLNQIRLKRLLMGYFSDKNEIRKVSKIIYEFTTVHQKIELWSRMHSIFHYWHIIHRPFAYIMYLIMFVHIGIALWLGYSWIF